MVIAAMAAASINQGAIAVRIDTPDHIQAVRQRVNKPIIGLWKQQIPGLDVYITPRFEDARAIALAGADMIAIDATLRNRLPGEELATLIKRIHEELGKPIMADIDTLEAARESIKLGVDLVGTTLYGYTGETADQTPPGWDLLADLVENFSIPIICEGGVSSPAMAKRALDMGAYAVVVGTDITGIDLKVQAYQKLINS
jgi:N-acylglucosamine-6-phosphate 2-epimerase